jgi:hypothetical protein
MRSYAVVGLVSAVGLVGCATEATTESGWRNPGGGGNASGQGDGGDTVQDDGGTTPDSAQDAGTPCQYPPGPYGKTQGSTLAPTLTWQGYAPGSSSVSTVNITDFFDCDGSKGINALAIDESALWCGACQYEAPQIEAAMKSGSWGPDGVKPLTLIIQNGARQPGTTADALTWKNNYSLDDVWVAADPEWSFSHPGQIGLPTNILVDPRTMKIVKIVEGASQSGPDPAIDALAQQNKKH